MHHLESVISARYGLEGFSQKIEEYWPEESIDVTKLMQNMITNGSIFLAERSIILWLFFKKNKEKHF